MRTVLLHMLLLTSVLAFSQSVKITAEKDVDYSVYKTFTLLKGELVTVTDQTMDTLAIHNNIRQGIIRELTGKGYTQVEDSTGQLLISYVAEMVTKMDVQDVGPLGQQPVDNPSQINASRNWSREYREGSLVIDVTDRINKKLVWRARSTVDITSVNEERVLNAIVFRSFKKFPKQRK